MDNKVPDLLPNETDTEEIIRGKAWKKRVKELPRMLKRLKINEKLFKWGKDKNDSKGKNNNSPFVKVPDASTD